jgi:NAD(P)-dependent dehydrogenase (short-subunit alcohol dehydrogenase family)|tara:strand:+ start:821 stop:1567 length:747 start_codon:yes stop_codon:yes gene_type:complete
MNEERVMVITGGSTGLGSELAKYFVSEGFRLVVNYFFDKDMQELINNNPTLGNKDKVLFSQADVSNREQVESMFDNAINKFGRVDILMNFAGINRDAPFTEITDDMWDSVIAAHLKGHFICGQEYVAHNTDREGLILNIGAACGQMGRKNGANFCSAKGAIFALTKCMALELAPRIRVNCLVPGSVRTREVIDRYDLETDDGLEKELATLPMGRLGEFEDIIHMVQSIIDAKFTTGANFYANGGQYMH